MQRGFTLIEVMVVVVILAVLATLVVPKIIDRPDEARRVKAKQDIAALEGAPKLYKLDNYVYPSQDQGLEALVTEPTGDPVPKNWMGYQDRLPKDPWGNPYVYNNPSQTKGSGYVDIVSLGADGVEGGEAAAADISNWDE